MWHRWRTCSRGGTRTCPLPSSRRRYPPGSGRGTEAHGCHIFWRWKRREPQQTGSEKVVPLLSSSVIRSTLPTSTGAPTNLVLQTEELISQSLSQVLSPLPSCVHLGEL